MGVIDVEDLLREISPDSPCGEDLEYDPAFRTMEEAARGKPEQVMGDTVLPAEKPNWRAVRDGAIGLLKRTKDLRVGVRLTEALVHTDGLAGLSEGLDLLRGLIETYWDSVCPRLDPDDGSDPTMRLNILRALADPQAIVLRIRKAPLVVSNRLGRFALHDIQMAAGDIAPSFDAEGTSVDMADIDAAFLECDLAELQATAAAIDRGVQLTGAIEILLAERVGAPQVPDFGPLMAVLSRSQRIVGEHLSRRGGARPPAVDETPSPAATPAPSSAPGEVTCREDVIRLLDRACEYFRRNEPSSPVPLLLERAKRLVSKDFIEIIRDLAPDGAAQAERVLGAESRDSSG